jgi:hypothetical protein
VLVDVGKGKICVMDGSRKQECKSRQCKSTRMQPNPLKRQGSGDSKRWVQR